MARRVRATAANVKLLEERLAEAKEHLRRTGRLVDRMEVFSLARKLVSLKEEQITHRSGPRRPAGWQHGSWRNGTAAWA